MATSTSLVRLESLRVEVQDGSQSLPRLRFPKLEISTPTRTSRASKGRSLSYSELDLPSSNIFQRFGSLTWRKKKAVVLESTEPDSYVSSMSESQVSLGRLDRAAVESNLDPKKKRPTSCIVVSPYSDLISKNVDDFTRSHKQLMEISTSFDSLANDDSDNCSNISALEVKRQEESLPYWAENMLKDYLTPDCSTPDLQDKCNSVEDMELDEESYLYRSPLYHRIINDKIEEETFEKEVPQKTDTHCEQCFNQLENTSTCNKLDHPSHGYQFQSGFCRTPKQNYTCKCSLNASFLQNEHDEGDQNQQQRQLSQKLLKENNINITRQTQSGFKEQETTDVLTKPDTLPEENSTERTSPNITKVRYKVIITMTKEDKEQNLMPAMVQGLEEREEPARQDLRLSPLLESQACGFHGAGTTQVTAQELADASQQTGKSNALKKEDTQKRRDSDYDEGAHLNRFIKLEVDEDYPLPFVGPKQVDKCCHFDSSKMERPYNVTKKYEHSKMHAMQSNHETSKVSVKKDNEPYLRKAKNNESLQPYAGFVKTLQKVFEDIGSKKVANNIKPVKSKSNGSLKQESNQSHKQLSSSEGHQPVYSAVYNPLRKKHLENTSEHASVSIIDSYGNVHSCTRTESYSDVGEVEMEESYSNELSETPLNSGLHESQETFLISPNPTVSNLQLSNATPTPLSQKYMSNISIPLGSPKGWKKESVNIRSPKVFLGEKLENQREKEPAIKSHPSTNVFFAGDFFTDLESKDKQTAQNIVIHSLKEINKSNSIIKSQQEPQSKLNTFALESIHAKSSNIGKKTTYKSSNDSSGSVRDEILVKCEDDEDATQAETEIKVNGLDIAQKIKAESNILTSENQELIEETITKTVNKSEDRFNNDVIPEEPSHCSSDSHVIQKHVSTKEADCRALNGGSQTTENSNVLGNLSDDTVDTGISKSINKPIGTKNTVKKRYPTIIIQRTVTDAGKLKEDKNKANMKTFAFSQQIDQDTLFDKPQTEKEKSYEHDAQKKINVKAFKVSEVSDVSKQALTEHTSANLSIDVPCKSVYETNQGINFKVEQHTGVSQDTYAESNCKENAKNLTDTIKVETKYEENKSLHTENNLVSDTVIIDSTKGLGDQLGNKVNSCEGVLVQHENAKVSRTIAGGSDSKYERSNDPTEVQKIEDKSRRIETNNQHGQGKTEQFCDVAVNNSIGLVHFNKDDATTIKSNDLTDNHSIYLVKSLINEPSTDMNEDLTEGIIINHVDKTSDTGNDVFAKIDSCVDSNKQVVNRMQEENSRDDGLYKYEQSINNDSLMPTEITCHNHPGPQFLVEDTKNLDQDTVFNLETTEEPKQMLLKISSKEQCTADGKVNNLREDKEVHLKPSFKNENTQTEGVLDQMHVEDNVIGKPVCEEESLNLDPTTQKPDSLLSISVNVPPEDTGGELYDRDTNVGTMQSVLQEDAAREICACDTNVEIMQSVDHIKTTDIKEKLISDAPDVDNSNCASLLDNAISELRNCLDKCNTFETAVEKLTKNDPGKEVSLEYIIGGASVSHNMLENVSGNLDEPGKETDAGGQLDGVIHEHGADIHSASKTKMSEVDVFDQIRRFGQSLTDSSQTVIVSSVNEQPFVNSSPQLIEAKENNVVDRQTKNAEDVSTVNVDDEMLVVTLHSKPGQNNVSLAESKTLKINELEHGFGAETPISSETELSSLNTESPDFRKVEIRTDALDVDSKCMLESDFTNPEQETNIIEHQVSNCAASCVNEDESLENMEVWVNTLRQLETPEFLKYRKPRREPHSSPLLTYGTLPPIKEDQGSPKSEDSNVTLHFQKKEEILEVNNLPSETDSVLETKEETENSNDSANKYSWERSHERTISRSSPLELMKKHLGEESSKSDTYKTFITQNISQRQGSIIGSLLVSERLDKKAETSDGKPFSRIENSLLLSSYLKPKKDQQKLTDATELTSHNDMSLSDGANIHMNNDSTISASEAQHPDNEKITLKLQSDNTLVANPLELSPKLDSSATSPCKISPDACHKPEKIHGKLNPRPGKIILFSEPGFMGCSYEVCNDVGNTSDWELPETISVRIIRGGWLLYEKPHFHGKRAMLTEGETDLSCPWKVQEPTSKNLTDETRKPKSWIGSLRHVVRDFQVPRISLFTEENGEGDRVIITEATPDSRVQGQPTKTESIIVHSGLWLVYNKPFFEGDPYIMESGGYPNRKAWLGQDSNVCSLQPAWIGGPTVEKPNEPKILLFKYPEFEGPAWEVTKDLHSLQDEPNHEEECLNTVRSIKVLGGCWVGYEKEGFHGHQYLLEEGEYKDWHKWGGCSEDLGSLRHICTDFSEPEIILYEKADCSEGRCLRINEALPDIKLAHYGTTTGSIHVLNGVWVAYENVDFSGEQYILEKGIYHSYQDWGAKNGQVCSVQPVLQVGGHSLHYSTKILLFSEPNFQGDCMTYVEDVTLLPDSFSLQSCRVEGGSWSLYEDKDYCGEQYILSEGDYPTRTAMGCQVSSTIQSLKKIPLYFSVPSISLHGLVKFEGKELKFFGEVRSLQGEGYNNHVLSIRVKSGIWVLYEHSDFRGRQWLLECTQIPNWLQYSGLQRIGSLCPVRQKRVYFRLRNHASGLLLSVPELLDGTNVARVQVAEQQDGSCNLWYYEEGRIKNQLAPNMSLQIIGAANPGTKVVLWSEGRKPVHNWTLDHSGYILSELFKGVCLDVKGGRDYDAEHVVMWNVTDDRPTQHWDLEVY